MNRFRKPQVRPDHDPDGPRPRKTWRFRQDRPPSSCHTAIRDRDPIRLSEWRSAACAGILRSYILTGWIAALSLTFTVFYRSSDSHVYLIPMLLSFAIWVGLGAGGVTHRFRQRPVVWRVGMALLLAVYFVGRSTTMVAQIDASKDLRAEMFGHELLSTAPEKAILFAKGDQAVFTLWYFHFALGERPDVAVVAVDLLHFDWYQENLEGLYPTLIVPSPFPWTETLARANAARPVCYIQTSDHTEIQCSPTFVPR